ncbi:MAG: PF20097 family protein [Mycobacteriaceae bacterium]
MGDEAVNDIPCPGCSEQMVPGWIALWNPIIGTKVRWQPAKAGYVRLRVPKGARVLLKTRFSGKDPRVAMRCPSCGTTVVPPDASYD